MLTLKEKFGARIQEIRKSKGLTQEKLAEMIGIDIPNLSNIERGKHFVSSDTLEKIISALNIEEKELFDFKHIKSRSELIKDITEILEASNDKDLKYYHKMISVYKES